MTSKQPFIQSDINKYYIIELGTTKLSLCKKIHFWINSFGLHCVAIYRLTKWANRIYKKNRVIGIVPLIIASIPNYFLKAFYQVNLDAADIGPGFYIGHIGTISLSKSTIGSNFSIAHNVTLGIGHSEGKVGAPTIGNNVWIGCGSTITGDITIGNNVAISPGSIVSRSIPDNCLVAGNPARVIMQNYDSKKLFPEALVFLSQESIPQ